MGPRLEYILRNCLLSLLDYPKANLADVLRLLSDKDFRNEVIPFVKNEQVKEFWLTEYNKYPERLKAEAISPIQNKVGAFLSHPLLKKALTSRGIESITPSLRKIGIRITYTRTSEARLIHIEKGVENASYPSYASSDKSSRFNEPHQDYFDFP